MSGLFGGSKVTTETKPWAPQAQQLQNTFSEAQNIYNSAKGTPFYQGDLYAGASNGTLGSINEMMDYRNGTGGALANQAWGAASALNDPTATNRALNTYEATATADPTQINISSAGLYAANPYLDGAIDAAARDVNRSLYESELPGINRGATAVGGINSSRAGIAEGIAMRGAGDRIGDIGAAMRMAAYDRGLGLAESARQANMGAQGNLAGLRSNNTANSVGALGAVNDMFTGNLNNAVTAGGLEQANRQGALDAQFAKWQGQDTRASDLLGRYYGIVGANNWGGTQTQTKTGGPGILGGILGGLSTFAGLGGVKGIGKLF